MREPADTEAGGVMPTAAQQRLVLGWQAVVLDRSGFPALMVGASGYLGGGRGIWVRSRQRSCEQAQLKQVAGMLARPRRPTRAEGVLEARRLELGGRLPGN